MSFFDDFFKQFEIKSVDDEVIVSFIVGVGVSVFGKIKIGEFDESEIVIISKNKRLKIIGEKLKIKSVAKGELFIFGNVKGVVVE